MDRPTAIFIRHAATGMNLSGVWQGRDVDPPLNSEGVGQAQALSKGLEHHFGSDPWNVVSSPLARARMTAQAIEAAGLSIDGVATSDVFLEADIGWMSRRPWNDYHTSIEADSSAD